MTDRPARVQVVSDLGKSHRFSCPRGDLNPNTREISPVRGNFHGPSITAGARGRQAFAFRAASRPGRRAEVGRGRSRGRRSQGLRSAGIPRLTAGRVRPWRAGHQPLLATACRGRTQPRRSRFALPAEPGQAKYPPDSVRSLRPGERGLTGAENECSERGGPPTLMHDERTRRIRSPATASPPIGGASHVRPLHRGGLVRLGADAESPCVIARVTSLVLCTIAAWLDARRRYRAIAQRVVVQPALHAAVGTGRTRLGPTTRRSTSRGAVGPGRPTGAAPAAELGRTGRRVAPR